MSPDSSRKSSDLYSDREPSVSGAQKSENHDNAVSTVRRKCLLYSSPIFLSFFSTHLPTSSSLFLTPSFSSLAHLPDFFPPITYLRRLSSS